MNEDALARIIRSNGTAARDVPMVKGIRESYEGGVSDFMHVLQFHAPADVEQMVLPEIATTYESARSLSKSDARLLELDSSGVLMAYFLVCFKPQVQLASSLLQGNSPTRGIRFFAVCSLIAGERAELLADSGDVDAMVDYFQCGRLAPEHLGLFAHPNLYGRIVDAVLGSDRGPMSVHLENLAAILESKRLDPAVIDVSAYAAFFKARDYHFPASMALFRSLAKLKAEIVERLVAVSLRIDPFSMQTRFDRWLVDVKRLGFLAELVVWCVDAGVVPATDESVVVLQGRSRALLPYVRTVLDDQQLTDKLLRLL